MSKWMSAVTLAGLVTVGLPACATKGFVRNRVGEVNGKVDNLSTSVEQTQERTKKNEAAISDVDQKAQAANAAAGQAQNSANAVHVAVSRLRRALQGGDDAPRNMLVKAVATDDEFCESIDRY